MKMIMFVLVSLFMIAANAQQYGLVAGIHNGEADEPTGFFDAQSNVGFRAGLLVKFDLTDTAFFRTGALYTQRKMEWEESITQSEVTYKFAYLDIPALFQIQVNEMFGFYAGPVVGINVSDKGEASSVAVPSANQSGKVDDVKDIYLLGQIGGNFMFDGIGFDVYYELGFGDVADDDAKDWKAFGANFVMLF